MNGILSNNFTKILKGVLLSGVITLILLFIYAVLLTYTNIDENTMIPVIIVITAVSILVRKFNSEQVL